MRVHFLPLLMITGTLAAQQFAPPSGRPPAEVPAGDLMNVFALADCDGDGDQDVAASYQNGQFAVRRQGPGATWSTENLLPNVVTAVRWADMDGDGDLDLLVGAVSNPIVGVPFGIARNDGATFLWRGQSPSVLWGVTHKCVVGDLDGDQLPDAVIGTTTGVQVARNIGNTTLGPATIVSTLPNARPELFDRDGDGDLDMVIASSAGAALLDNTLGVFTVVSTFAATGVEAVARDLDGDGRIDLAFANGGSVDVHWNQPNGWLLAAAVVPAVEQSRELLAGDLDQDGDVDLAVRTQMEVDWLRNAGNRTFVRLPGIRRGGPMPIARIALGDGAARGASDVVAAYLDGQVRTLYGAAPEPFLDPQAQAQPAPLGQIGNYVGRIAIGDVDGDGLPDVVSPADREVLHNDGRGSFSRRPIPGARPDYAGAWLADLDGDADLDLVLGAATLPVPPFVPLQRFENDGLGNFTAVQDVPFAASFQDFRVGDADGDGDTDLLMPFFNGQVLWIANLGNGVLADLGTISSIPPIQVGNDLVFEDLDGDGDRDIVCGQINDTLPVHLNNGAGWFTTASSLALTPGSYAYEFRAADLDGDGDRDIVVAASTDLTWYRNQGAGTFVRETGSFPGGGYGNLEFADIDEDGDLDLVSNGSLHQIMTNDGTGVFQDAPGLLWSPLVATPQILDLDEDDDVDLLAVVNNSWQRINNRSRAAESLQRVQPGGSMQVRFFVQPQAPTASSLVLSLASLAAGPSTAIPGIRGRLLLSPAGTVPLGVVSAASGTATSGFPIPPAPSLIGTSLYMQGLAVTAGNLAFTNVVDERILP